MLAIDVHSWEELFQINLTDSVGWAVEGATVSDYKKCVDEVIEDFAHAAELH